MAWCGEVWCGAVWAGAVWCGVAWYGMVLCGVVRCGVLPWSSMVWCGVVWCGVVSCGAPSLLRDRPMTAPPHLHQLVDEAHPKPYVEDSTDRAFWRNRLGMLRHDGQLTKQ